MLDEWVSEDSLVRVVDAWVGSLELKALDAQDRQDSSGDARAQDVRRVLQRLQGQQAQMQESLERLEQGRGNTAVRGEPQAQVMVQAGNRAPAFNLQTAVESQSPMVVAHEITNEANDQRQLQPMAQAASRVPVGLWRLRKQIEMHSGGPAFLEPSPV